MPGVSKCLTRAASPKRISAVALSISLTSKTVTEQQMVALMPPQAQRWTKILSPLSRASLQRFATLRGVVITRSS
jgi:hypothetical protein